MDPRDPLEADLVIGSDEIDLDDESFVDDDSYLVGRRRDQMVLHLAFVNLRRRDVADVVDLDDLVA